MTRQGPGVIRAGAGARRLDRGMARLETVSRAHVVEEVHASDTVALDRSLLRLPGADDAPPLAIERSHLPDGPTRPPVLLVHGLAQNRLTWRISRRSFQAFLARQGFDVWNLELRGHGRSREYGAPNARAFADYVSDVSRVVQAMEDRPFLCGHSLGAAACIGALEHVEARGLIHLAGVYTFAQANRTLRTLARLSLALEPVLTLAPVRVRTGWAGTLLGELYSLSDVAGYGAPIAGWTPGSIERDLLAERLEQGFDWTSVEVWLQMCRWALGERIPGADAFEASDVPLLVAVGDHDVLVRRVDGEACYRASGSSDKQLVVFDAWNHERHWGHLDLILGHTAPRQVWPVLGDWLNARCP